MSVKIEEKSGTVIEIDIPIEWYGLGKETCMRYAENIAEAVYLGPVYRASMVTPIDGKIARIRLSKGVQ